MMEPPYSTYATVYDRLGQAWFGEAAALEVLAWLTAQGVVPTRVLDLCCGTGSASLVFAEHGMSVSGIDRSSAMLEVARTKAADADRELELFMQDVTTFDVAGPFDLVTCFYDSLNYLGSEQDLRWVVERVRQVIAEDGWFAFDLNSRKKLEREWIGTMIAADEPDLFVVYDATYNVDTGQAPLKITGFVEGDTGYRRFVEEHVERPFALADVLTMLSEAGFETVYCFAFFDRPPHLGPPAEESHSRWLLLASPSVREPAP